jgi:hypothetical protein
MSELAGVVDGRGRDEPWGGVRGGVAGRSPTRRNMIILDFLTNEPVPTVAPIRRAK